MIVAMLESDKIQRCPHGWPVDVGWTSDPERSARCECCCAPCFGEDALCGACARPEDYKEIKMICKGCGKTFTMAVVQKNSMSWVSRWCDGCPPTKDTE